MLEAAAEVVIGRHDFRGFCVAESQKEDCHCQVSVSKWHRQDSLWIYRIAADRFLHQMVRLLVGTMVDIARGRFEQGQMQCIIDSGDVRLCGTAAPSQGLTLSRILYPGDNPADGEFG